MSTVTEFLAMGGYAFYVWSSFGLTLLVLLANVVQPRIAAKKLKRQLSLEIEAAGGNDAPGS